MLKTMLMVGILIFSKKMHDLKLLWDKKNMQKKQINIILAKHAK
jgi:hypothetical protein